MRLSLNWGDSEMKLAFAYLGNIDVSSSPFDCGDSFLNDFLTEDAARFVEQGLSAVKLLVDQENSRVVGFYAISPMSIEIGRLSPEQRNQYDVAFPIPAWLIGRLAVDKAYQKQHLGAALLRDAMTNITQRAAQGAGALIIVDAKNKKIKNFYKKYGFSTLPSSGLKLACPIR